MNIDLATASVEDIVNALIALESERPGFAYDVGQSLIGRQVQKVFPGPAFGTPDPAYTIQITGFDPARRMDAIKGFRLLWSLPVRDALQPMQTLFDGGTVIDPGDPWQQGEWFSPSVISERIARWAFYGITAVIQGVPVLPQTHTCTLGETLNRAVA